MARSSLSQRELKVAELAARGLSNREIASDVRVTEQVVKNILHSVFDKLGIWNRVELARCMLSDEPSKVIEHSLGLLEDHRQRELHRRQILDSTSESAFDEITELAVKVFQVPIAIVALIDSGRVWFKSNIGLSVSEVPRELTVCHHTIQQSSVLALSDAREDARFVCNPLINEFGVRFYAAAPILTSDGYALGVVCIVDKVPRQFSESQLSVLISLAKLALHHIEIRKEFVGSDTPRVPDS